MNTWVERSMKAVTCADEGCKLQIEVGKACIRVKLDAKSPTISFHPLCWAGLAEKFAELADARSPHVRRGRRPLPLSQAQLAERGRLLHKHAALQQKVRRLRAELDSHPCESAMLSILHCQLKDLVLARQMVKVGGVPRSWELLVPVGEAGNNGTTEATPVRST